MAALRQTESLHCPMDRRFIDKQFQQLQKDTLAGCLRPNKNGDVSEADIGIRDRPDLTSSYSLNHIQIALSLFATRLL